MRNGKKTRRFLQHKRLIIGLGIIVVLAGCMLWSSGTWRQYEDHYQVAMLGTKIGIDEALQLPQSTQDEKMKKLAALTAIADSYQPIDCQVNALVDWQAFLDDLKRIKATCEDKAMKLDALMTEMRHIVQYFEDDQKLVAAMMTQDQPGVVTEEVIEDQVKAWQQVKGAVQSLEVSEAFAPVKTKAQDAASTIFAVWEQLFEAHKTQDQAAYEEARANLAASYDTLAAVVSIGSQHLAELTKKWQASYDEAYK